MKKRLLACLLTAAMLVSLFPLPALAAETEPYTGGLCPHHQEHSYEVCGYIEAVEGQLCGHVHDGDCGFVEAVPEVPCDMDCAETGEDSQIIHVEGCAYTPAVEGAPCQHKHDGECGYVEAIEGQPCGYVCPTCSMQAANDLPMPAVEGETGDFTVMGGTAGTDYSYDATTHILTVLSKADLTISGNTTRDRIVVEGGIEANITLNNLSIQFSDGSEGDRNHREQSGTCAFAVGRSTVCNLTLVGDNTLQSGYHQAALEVPGDATLTIEGPGAITANGGKRGAGIGGSRYMSCGTITINSGTVEAHGSIGGAGIGGGGRYGEGSSSGGGGGNGGKVTIKGGTVTATATNDPGTSIGGIGGGAASNSNGTLTITDGTLKDADVTSDEFTMTGGTLEGCTIQNASVPLNNATIRNSTLNNLSSWTDANNTVSGSTLNFTKDVAQITLTRGGAGNTYNIPVTITDNVSFSGNTTFGSTVDITGNVTLDGITELTGNVTISAGGSLTNKGTLTVPGDCTITNHATITNNEGAVINLSGVIDNQTDPASTVANNGTIFLIRTGRVLGEDRLTGKSPVSVGTVPIPAGEIVIDMSAVSSTVTIGPKSYTIDGVSTAYDPAQNNIVLTSTYGGDIRGSSINPVAAVTVLENTTASIVLRDVDIGWERDWDQNYRSSIWVKDYCTVTVFLEGTNTLKPRWLGNGITTEEHSSLTVEGAGTLILDMSNSKYSGYAGIGNPNRNFGSITLNGGNIVTKTTNDNETLIGIGGKRGTVTINGGTLNGPYLFGDSSGGDITNEYQLVINGGVIKSETKWSLLYGSLTINGGEVSLPTVYCYGSSGGKIAVNGGQLTLTSTSTSEYMYGNITINGGTVTGRVNPTLYGGTKINGGSAKLTNNSDSQPVASIPTTDGKTAYRTELTGQTSVADLLVDGKSQNISYNHPSDTSLYLYLVHDADSGTPDTHTVVVMYQDESRKKYTATWGGSAFTFNNGVDSNPTDNSSINLDLSGTTTGEDGKPEKTFGDAAPVVVTVNLTTQTTNALPPANGPMLAAENSLPYAFKTVILLCNGKEIQRKNVPENQTSVVFYVQTQAWTPGEYKFTATYGGDASTGSSITTQAETLNIVGQTLDESALNWNNVAVSGTYGQKVSDLTASGTVTQGDGTEIPGAWTISDSNTDAVLDVGTMQTVTVTFAPTNTKYAPLTKTVTPTIAPKELTATIGGTTSKTYDGTTNAPDGLTIELTGKVSGDDVSATAQTITYDNANVGTGKTITASGITLTGTKAGNYTLTNTTATTTGDITQATINGTLSITGTAAYGQTLTASYAPSNGETVSYQWNRGGAAISGATGSTYTLTADDIGQTITVTATPTNTTNYTGSVTSSATAAVAKATPTVKVEVALSGSTGAREAVLTVTITGVTGGAAPTETVTLTDDNSLNQSLKLDSSGKATYTWSSLTDGQHKVTATYGGDVNYNTASMEKTFDTSKREQNTLAIGSVGNKTYGDSAFILSTTGGSGNGAVTFTSSDPSVISISGTTATIYKAGGPVTITATKAENEHYNAATATLTVYVAKKAVVFKANDKTVQQGGTMPTFDYAPVTLAQGDSITTEPTAACTATDTNTTGTFPITLSGAVLSNGDSYDISYQPGTLTVTAKPSTGGGGGGGGWYNPPTTYSVTIPTTAHGKVTVSPTSASRGATVTITAVPEDGYRLDTLNVTSGGKDIALTEKGSGKYTFTMPAGTVKVTATFVPAETPETPWNNPFADVSEGDWYYEAVRFVQERGLMNGYSDGRFGPNDTLSRAQLAQILFNKEGRPGVNYLMDFSDVAGEAWYTEAIRWAASQGIVSGYGNGTFGPNDPITREQLAVMLWRYVGSPAATNKELHFNDTDEISGFALEAMRWAVENGILNGYGDGRLGPQGQATRAQVAQMLKNFIENQEENT